MEITPPKIQLDDDVYDYSKDQEIINHINNMLPKPWNISHWAKSCAMPIAIAGVAMTTEASVGNTGPLMAWFAFLIVLVVAQVHIAANEKPMTVEGGFQKTMYVIACVFAVLFCIAFLYGFFTAFLSK